MKIKEVAVTFNTDKVSEAKEFYSNYLEGKITFDCGWYVVVTFNNGACIGLMEPQTKEPLMGGGQATVNFMVEDVDVEYAKLKQKDVEFVVDLTNQPWGDRSFQIVDPLGNVVYIYSPAEVSDEYKDAIKE